MNITVRPAPDGHDMQQNWEVKTHNGTYPKTTKSAALNKAYEVGSAGDTLEIRRTDGSIQDRRTIQGSRESSDSSSQQGGIPGMGTFTTGITDAFE